MRDDEGTKPFAVCTVISRSGSDIVKIGSMD